MIFLVLPISTDDSEKFEKEIFRVFFFSQLTKQKHFFPVY